MSNVEEDFNSPAGTVLYVLTVEARGPPGIGLLPTYFWVKTNASQYYDAFGQLGGSTSYLQSPLGYGLQVETIALDRGGLGTGQLVFQLPHNQTLTELGYQVNREGLRWPNAPAVTGVLQRPTKWSQSFVTGLMVNVESPPGTPQASVVGWIVNNSVAYEQGRRLTVDLFIGCMGSIAYVNENAETINSTSITELTMNLTNEFRLASLTPILPYSIRRCPSGSLYSGSLEAEIVVLSSDYSGPLQLNIVEQQQLPVALASLARTNQKRLRFEESAEFIEPWRRRQPW